MKFSLSTLIGFMTYCCAIATVARSYSFQLPIHWASFGTLRSKIDTRFYDIELTVWLPVLVLATICFFRLVSTPWKIGFNVLQDPVPSS